ncbi:MAG TPA: DUF1203 domain-containing protein [Kofleriaceae bacterium]
MHFRIMGLSPDAFRPLYGLSDDELARRGARRYIADAKPGFPDRIEMRDAEPGESLILVNHVHQAANTPYHASHAVFVREGAEVAFDAIDRVPEVLRLRKLSLRAFSADHYLAAAVLVDGRELEGEIAKMLARSDVAYIHVHYAAPGCYAARVERAWRAELEPHGCEVLRASRLTS